MPGKTQKLMKTAENIRCTVIRRERRFSAVSSVYYESPGQHSYQFTLKGFSSPRTDARQLDIA